MQSSTIHATIHPLFIKLMSLYIYLNTIADVLHTFHLGSYKTFESIASKLITAFQ